MKKIITCIVIILVGYLSSPAFIQANPLQISVPSMVFNPGDSISVPVFIDQEKFLYNYDIAFEYDFTILEFQGITCGNQTGYGPSGEIFLGFSSAIAWNLIDNYTEKKIWVSFICANGMNIGSCLFNLNFEVINSGQCDIIPFIPESEYNPLSGSLIIPGAFQSNTKPIANAGEDQLAVLGDTITLNGSHSNDPDGAPLFYDWNLKQRPSGSSSQLSKSSSSETSFVADTSGEYIVSLTVNDGVEFSDPYQVNITVLSVQDALLQIVAIIRNTINSFFENIFASTLLNEQRKNIYIYNLDQIYRLVESDSYFQSYWQLHYLLSKTDGCSKSKGSPDFNDWIKDCEAQKETYALIQEAMDLLDRQGYSNGRLLKPLLPLDIRNYRYRNQ